MFCLPLESVTDGIFQSVNIQIVCKKIGAFKCLYQDFYYRHELNSCISKRLWEVVSARYF